MTSGEHPTTDPWVSLPPAELFAVVGMNPAPDIALASIRDLLQPVHDEAGQLIDWLLDASRFDDHDAVRGYMNWRRAWRQQWPIGNVANLASLRDEAADVVPNGMLVELLDGLVRADGQHIDVAPDRVNRLADDLATIRLALSVDQRAGVGIIDDMPTSSRGGGLARTWAHPTSELVLASSTVTAAVIRPESGLTVLYGGPEHATFADVTGVDLRAEPVLAMNRRGASLRLSQEQARPLGWLVPRSLRWHLRAIPIVVVWALTFDGLGRALAAAVQSGEPVVISGELSIT